jgi:hypothetical protein
MLPCDSDARELSGVVDSLGLDLQDGELVDQLPGRDIDRNRSFEHLWHSFASPASAWCSIIPEVYQGFADNDNRDSGANLLGRLVWKAGRSRPRLDPTVTKKNRGVQAAPPVEPEMVCFEA